MVLCDLGVVDLGDNQRWSFKRDNGIGTAESLMFPQSLSDPLSQNQRSTMACYWSPFPDHSPSARESILSLQADCDGDGRTNSTASTVMSTIERFLGMKGEEGHNNID